MISILDAVMVGLCTGWITWQILDTWRSWQARRLLDRIRRRQND